MIEIPDIKLNSQKDKESIDFEKMHKESFVDLRKPLKPQPVAISIGDTVRKGNIYPIAFGSYGDFSCIVGASKSRKTWFKSLIEASYAGGNTFNYAPKIKGHSQEGKLIVSIDTEQSDYHTQMVGHRVEELIGSITPFYKPHALRKYSTFERLQYIEWLLYESNYRDKIGLLTIDGIADLTDDVNDLQTGNMITQNLLKWTAEKNCHIVTILHKNFASMKPTGHLGSAVMKKAETVAFVEKEDNFSKVSAHEYTRNLPFEPFMFGVNNDWLPYIVEDNIAKKEFEPRDFSESKNKDNTPF